MPLSRFLPLYVRNIIQEHPYAQIELPHVNTQPQGIVAIIDISGFSKLTSSLTAKFGDSGGAFLADHLNRPFEKILNIVHNRNGSVVKFAGDSVIVSWNVPTPKKDPTDLSKDQEAQSAENIIDATLCCLELLTLFRDYKIKVSKRTQLNYNVAKNMTSDMINPPFLLHGRTVKLRRTLKKRGETKKLTKIIPEAHTDDGNADIIDIKIHIGLSFGETSHVILGMSSKNGDLVENQSNNLDIAKTFNNYNKNYIEAPFNGRNARFEYFVAGPAMKESADLLYKSKSGELLISKTFWFELAKNILKLDHSSVMWNLMIDKHALNNNVDPENPRQRSSNDSAPVQSNALKSICKTNQDGDIVVSDSNINLTEFSELLADHSERHYKNEGYVDEHDENFTTKQQFDLGLGFIEESLSTVLAYISKDLNMDSELDVLSEYQQIRNVTSVFIRFSSLMVKEFSSQKISNLAQKAIKICLYFMQKYGGCCRQFNCDDKSTSLLMIWGMEGFAHENGEAFYALSAALEIKKELSQLFGNEFSIGIASGSV